MARGKLTFLQKDEIEYIHRTSIKVLEEIGVSVLSDSVTKLLLDYGAVRSKDNKRVLIPENVIKAAISSLPKSMLLAAFDKQYDIRIPSEDRLYIANGGEGVYIKDLISGKTRSSTLNDFRDFTILIMEMPQVDFQWGMVGALDQPEHLKEIIELKTAFEFCSKHPQMGPLNSKQAEQQVKLASILAGGEKELEKRPIFSAVVCPISPLTFEKGLSEAQVTLARAAIPVIAMSASLAGLTSPITVSGTLVQVNAENLASLVITQAARKGAPWVYSSDSSPADLKTGSIDYSAFEAPLIRTGAGQLGKYYGFSTMVSGAALENTSLVIRELRDGIPYMILEALIPSDLGSGIGGIDNAAGASYEQFMIDSWVWELAREFTRAFDSDAAAISFETIQEAALDKTYLNKPHTLKRYKSEFLGMMHPEFASRTKHKAERKGSLLKKAKEEATKLLKKPKTPVVPKDLLKEMNDYVKSQNQPS